MKSLHDTTAYASYWISAASTGFAVPADWRSWADKIIIKFEQPPIWVINLSLANTIDEFYKAIEERKNQEDSAAGHVISLGNAKLGFRYLRYERGDYSLHDFLIAAGDEADGGTSDLSCEFVYSILNTLEIEGDYPDTVESAAFKSQELFYPYKRIATEQWTTIQFAVV